MIHYRIVLSIAVVLLSSCGAVTLAAPPAPIATNDAASLSRQLDALRTGIAGEVGTPTAKDVSQCGAMAVGAKACGGPTHYIVYSRAVSNEARLRGLVERYTQVQRQLNELEQKMSDCSMLMAPTLTLVGGLCRAE